MPVGWADALADTGRCAGAWLRPIITETVFTLNIRSVLRASQLVNAAKIPFIESRMSTLKALAPSRVKKCRK